MRKKKPRLVIQYFNVMSFLMCSFLNFVCTFDNRVWLYTEEEKKIKKICKYVK